jgi:hypothetical protein
MSGASTATAARGRAFFRSAAAAGLIGFALDPDNGEDQNDTHALAWSAIRG